MSLTPTIYRSTDPGAPLLSGTAGALLTVLDAILVDGYGLGESRKAGMGWTKAFSGSGLRAYRGSPTTGSGYYLRVDDTAARSSLLRGYSSMSDINTGTDPVPSDAMKSIGSRWDKSNNASAEARHWLAVGNERFFYLFLDTAGNFATQGTQGTFGHYAGDMISMRPGDRHNFCVSYKGSDTEASSSIGYAFKAQSGWASSGGSDSTTASFIARSFTGAPGSVRAFLSAPGQASGGLMGSLSSFPAYPYPGNGGLLYGSVDVLEAAYLPRGRLPGIYAPIHRRPFPDQGLLTDVEGLPPGTELMAKNVAGETMSGYHDSYTGQILIDMTNAWE
ncbi:hypothetical protein [Stenotrophomonas maltophilia]|uniref:hypothetical protein n=1 Tax=Stenotrophomonas maltophilia TaxID=40324 RepID=UPI0021C7D049|nr:hypothetical protein [Stenotrophomonas maltophilia]MCU1068538.1 hypothetical protein [Stenotrophomonas maltophilia]MCU1075507.1 hypothetical protein [Stenotrophomonas maltophilia]